MVAFRLGTEALAKLGNSSTRPHVHVIGHPGHVQEQDRIEEEDYSARRTSASQNTGVADSFEKGKGEHEYHSDGALPDDEEAFLDASEKNPVVAQVRKLESQTLPLVGTKKLTPFSRDAGSRLWASRRSSLEFAFTRSLSD